MVPQCGVPPKREKAETIKAPAGQQLKTLGVNVRRERLRRGLTQDRLAEMTELASRNIQRIEAGELNILVTTLSRIQKALKCPWENLLGNHPQD